ncbi:MAG: hypothetical protein U0P45_15660 [Acidimicrobiales bacterium]
MLRRDLSTHAHRAGLQATFGWFDVGRRGRPGDAVGRSVTDLAGVPFDVRVRVHVRNRVHLVFRGALTGEPPAATGWLAPDVAMRAFGFVGAVFGTLGLGAVAVGVWVVGVAHEHVDVVPLALWTMVSVGFSVGWARAYGRAVHEAVAAILREAPDTEVRWRPGLRTLPGWQPPSLPG